MAPETTRFPDPAQKLNWAEMVTGIPAIELGHKFLTGELVPGDKIPDPMKCFGPLEELQPNLAFILFFANVTVINTSEGFILIDGGGIAPKLILSQIQDWKPETKSFHTAIYTHGHLDHVEGIRIIERLTNKFRVVGHKNISRRFDRYKLTKDYNEFINKRQFQTSMVIWPRNYRYPDLTYEDQLELEIGDEKLVLYHAMGETDDATWIWLPKRRTIISGDLVLWVFPNCGNPQKAQRYPLEWVQALRKMASLHADLLLPGHGPPISGADYVEQVLTDTANALESIVKQTLEQINAGVRLEDIVNNVVIPPEVYTKIYLKPVYDQPEFVIRNIWRLYAGWWDGNPAFLEPSPVGTLSGEIVSLCGTKKLEGRISELLNDPTKDNLALAAHLAEILLRVSPDDANVKKLYGDVYSKRASQAISIMARGIYTNAATTQALYAKL